MCAAYEPSNLPSTRKFHYGGHYIMPKKGENIYKRRDGRWEGRYIRCYDATGKAKYGYVYGKTYGDVKDTLVQKKADAIHHPFAESQRTVVYNDILDTWLRASKLKTKESTHARYAQLVRTHIKPQLGGYQLSKISTQQVEGFVTYLLCDGRLDGTGGLSLKTVSDILTIIKNTMEYARYQNMPVACNINKLTVKKKDGTVLFVFMKIEKNLSLGPQPQHRTFNAEISKLKGDLLVTRKRVNT